MINCLFSQVIVELIDFKFVIIFFVKRLVFFVSTLYH